VRWILSRIEMFDVKQLSTFEPLGGRYGAPTDA
jgi:hypothetical protein